MPEANAGPDPQAVTAESRESSEIHKGFAEALVGLGHPSEVVGEPVSQAAVETEAQETPPKSAEVKPVTAPTTDEVKRDPAETPNFDGLSDDDKKTYERLWKAGFVTKEEVERFRKNTLYQQSWTRNNMEAAEKIKAAEARATEVEKWKTQQEDRLQRLERILSDDRRHQAFMRASGEEFTEQSVDPDQPVSRAEAQRIADERYDARLKADADRDAKEKAEYRDRTTAMKRAVHEEAKIQGITAEQLKSYLDAEEAELPADKDPILHYSPNELRRIIALRHRAAQAEAKAIAAEKKVLNGKSESLSKQSLAPSRRVAETQSEKTAWQRSLAEVGAEPDLSNVQGLGGWGDHRNGTT